MIPVELKDTLSIHPDIMGGEICFTGTRVPVKIVLDNLHDGIGATELLDAYPALKPAQVQAILDWEYRQAAQTFGFVSASA